tara:strand:+ start:490 stop:1212 length:723 start_codon:yes stop_codon:yes gene_type:complete
MADSLVLKGFKEVKKHTGKEMQLQLPKRGSETKMKKWWAVNAGQVQYVSCALFKVTVSGNSVLLAVDASPLSTVRIDHDGNFNFNFYICNGVTRAALLTEDKQIIEHYLFPRISGGKIMTVIPPGAAERPFKKDIGVVTVSGPSSGKEGDTCTFNVETSGSVTNVETETLSYQWTLTGEGEFVGKTTLKSAKVKLGKGNVGVTCTASSADANVCDSPQSGFRVVSVEPTPEPKSTEEASD